MYRWRNDLAGKPAGGDDFIVVIGDGELSGGSGHDGFVERECGGAVGMRDERGGARFHLVTDLDVRFEGGVDRRRFREEPVELVEGAFAAEHVLLVGDGDGIAGEVGAEDEPWAAAEAEAAALAGSIAEGAVVSAEGFAVGVADRPFAVEFGVPGEDEAGEVAVGEETEVLAFGFGGGDEAEFGNAWAEVLLAAVAEGEDGVRELRLGELGEEIALVFGGIETAEQAAAGAVAEDAGVMAGGQAVAAMGGDRVPEGAEFEMAVADDAGRGSETLGVGVGAGLEDEAVEGFAEVDGMERDAETAGDGGRLVGDGAVGREDEGEADDGITVFQKPEGRGGAVSAAGESDADGEGTM